MTSRKRLLIVDDYRPLVEAYAGLLAPEYEVVGLVTDGDEVFHAVRELKPHVVILDIAMPKVNGLDAGDRLKREHPSTKVIYLSGNESAALTLEAFRRGASAYVVKTGIFGELRSALQTALAGKFYISTQAAREVLGTNITFANTDQCPKFTPRQQQIFEMFVEGHNAEDISAVLDISPRTVAYHKFQIMQILGVSSKLELLLLVLSIRALRKTEQNIAAD